MIDHHLAHHDAADQPRVQVGFLEAGRDSLSQLSGAAGEQRRRILELLDILGLRHHQPLNVAGIVGIKLALHDGLR